MTDEKNESNAQSSSAWTSSKPADDTKFQNQEKSRSEFDRIRNEVVQMTSSKSLSDIRAAVTRAVISSVTSTPTASPVAQRRSAAPDCKSQVTAKNWLFPLIGREMGGTRLSVSNFDMNAVSPNSW
jgi:hypothetical protein